VKLLESKYLRLVRPKAWICFLFPLAAGFGLGVASGVALIRIVSVFASFVFSCCFVFTLNALADVDVDRFHDGRSKDMNLSKQPLLTGELTTKQCSLLSVLFMVASLLFGLLVNSLCFALVLAVNIIGFIYSMRPTRLKARPLGDIVCNAVAGMLFFAAGLNIANIIVDPVLMLGAFLLASVFYIPTMVTDYEFDKRAELKTTVVLLGPRKTLRIMYPLVALTILVMLIIFVNYDLRYKILAVMVIPYTTASAFVANFKLKGEKLDVSAGWILYPFALMSFAFISYGLLKAFGIHWL